MAKKSSGPGVAKLSSPTIASIDGQQVHNDILLRLPRGSGDQFFQNWISRECVPMTYSMKRVRRLRTVTL